MNFDEEGRDVFDMKRIMFWREQRGLLVVSYARPVTDHATSQQLSEEELRPSSTCLATTT
jgi:hypothetical protein